jgi:hypothetical protein
MRSGICGPPGWSFSSGVAGGTAPSADGLHRDADAAVYRSKGAGGGRTSVSAAPAATIATPGTS